MRLAKLVAIFWGSIALPVVLCGLTLGIEPSGYTGATVPTASTIDVTITLSRTSGVTPAFVQATAAATTGTGISYPWTDIEYSWTMGDATGDNIIHPLYAGLSVATNSGQKAPEAFFKYAAAGVYTIRCDARVWTGSAYITDSDTATFTATAWAGTQRYYDSVAGSPTGTGTILDPISSVSDLMSWVRAGNDREACIKAGSTFVTTGIWDWGPSTSVTRSGQRISKYGSGPDPIITTTSGVAPNQMVRVNANNVNILWRDFVCTAIKFDAAGFSKWVINPISSSGTMSNIYFDSCTFTNPNTVDGSKCFYLAADPTTPCNNCGWYRCLFDGGVTAETGMLNDSEGDYHCYMGCEWTGGGTGAGIDDTLDHHLYPSTCSHLAILYNWFHAGGNFNYCVNGNCHNTGSGGSFEEDYHCYSDTWFADTRSGIDASSTNGNANTGQIGHVLCQRSRFTGLGDMQGSDTNNTGSSWFFFYAAHEFVGRDCEGWDNTPDVGVGTPVVRLGDGTNVAGLDSRFDLYRCKIVIPSTFDANQEWIRIDPRSNQITGTIRDNTIIDLRASSRIINVPYTKCLNVWSNNRIFHPNDSSLTFRNNNTTNGLELDFEAIYGSGAVTLTNAQNPAWMSPTTGIFERFRFLPRRR